MKVLQEMVFISEIVLQSKIALRAAERLQSNHTFGDKVEVWCSIQSILVAAGNVFKILRPHQKNKVRGERLRQILKVDKKNILSDRKFRNHFENYYERTEEWFDNQSSNVHIDLAMNPSLQGFMTFSVHRGNNTFNKTLIFRGESLDLNAALKALEELLNNCKPYVLT